MNITINTNLKKLRQEKGTTQENLAEHLDISFQAISKWERGEAFPDITLLPKIAAYYNVSVDDLLGVSKIRRKEKIEEYRKRTEKENRLEVCQEAYKEFPNDLDVIHDYMRALDNNTEKNASKIIELAEKLINESNEEENYWIGATQVLCYTYNKLGDVEKAKKYAGMLPTYMVTYDQIMMTLLNGEEAVKQIQWNLIMLADITWLNVINIAREGNYKPEEKIKFYKYALKLFELLFEGDYGFYYNRTYDLYWRTAKCYAEMKDLENTIKSLEISAEHNVKWLNLSDNSVYKSIFVNRHGYKNENWTAYIKEQLEDMQEEIYNFCRADAKFKTIEKKLQEYIN
jgi:transcriptional regulator with XRE-family HTH domain